MPGNRKKGQKNFIAGQKAYVIEIFETIFTIQDEVHTGFE